MRQGSQRFSLIFSKVLSDSKRFFEKGSQKLEMVLQGSIGFYKLALGS